MLVTYRETSDLYFGVITNWEMTNIMSTPSRGTDHQPLEALVQYPHYIFEINGFFHPFSSFWNLFTGFFQVFLTNTELSIKHVSNFCQRMPVNPVPLF